MNEWCDHNVSIAVKYNLDEIEDIGTWLTKNWDDFVGVSFMPHDDTMYGYHPHQQVTKEEYDTYKASLRPLNWVTEEDDLVEGIECEGGACPLR